MSSGKTLTPYLKKLVADPNSLTAVEVVEALDLMIDGHITDIQVSAFLSGLRITGMDHQSDFIAATATRIFQESLLIDKSKLDPKGYVDIVGTGGDGKNTFNVSTTAAIVAAGMGIKVCKHGGKASTSTSGAGDLLRSLGSYLERVTNETAPEILSRGNFTFLFAPVFHPMMASLAYLRKTLGIPTIYNIVGPLLNPVPLRARIIGVYAEKLGRVFAEAVVQMNAASGMKGARAMIVWGSEGLDEISPATVTKVWRVDGDHITEGQLVPEDFGLPRHPLEDVASGTPEENAKIVEQLLDGKLQEGHPILDYVLMNASALAVVEGTAKDWKHGVELARESIASGRARSALDVYTDATATVGRD
jgi:anthranilate phosphoribosyltransferase